MRPLGAIATRVLELTEGDKFSAHELATVIPSDQALSAKMLPLSNSAYYGFPRRISTVRDAVVLLGFRAVRSATLASCVIDALPPGQVLDYERFWHFSVSVGMLAELLGRAERIHQDEAFTAGVLHNVGRLALDQRLPQALQLAVRLAERVACRCGTPRPSCWASHTPTWGARSRCTGTSHSRWRRASRATTSTSISCPTRAAWPPSWCAPGCTAGRTG